MILTNLLLVIIIGLSSLNVVSINGLPFPTNLDITYKLVVSTDLASGGTVVSMDSLGKLLSATTFVKVLFHDTVVDARNAWFPDFTKAYIGGTATNVVLQVYISNLLPIISTIQLDDISSKIAAFIDQWANYALVPYDTNLHFIGHGIGAHIAGKTARKLSELRKLNTKIARVTGLNPGSFTQFIGKFNPDLTLQRTDAKFVDVIHTECVVFGSCDIIGDADFYPNGALVQPGCTIINPLCSHDRATQYFVDSMTRQDSYQARQCQSYSLFERGLCSANGKGAMGIKADATPSLKGRYYLKTKSEAPYGLNQV